MKWINEGSRCGYIAFLLYLEHEYGARGDKASAVDDSKDPTHSILVTGMEKGVVDRRQGGEARCLEDAGSQLDKGREEPDLPTVVCFEVVAGWPQDLQLVSYSLLPVSAPAR